MTNPFHWLQASFGFGDRIGLATPGHVAAMLRLGSGIAPIFPQQSIREMTRTARSPQQVMNDAMTGARAAGWTGAIGADADHLKTTNDVDVTAAVGFTFFTIDPSGSVDQRADDYDEATLRAKFADARLSAPWFEKYLGRSISLPSGTRIELTEEACMRAAVKYGRAIAAALELAITSIVFSGLHFVNMKLNCPSMKRISPRRWPSITLSLTSAWVAE